MNTFFSPPFSGNDTDREISSGTRRETVRAFVAATRSPGDSMQFVALKRPQADATRQKSGVSLFRTIHIALKRVKNFQCYWRKLVIFQKSGSLGEAENQDGRQGRLFCVAPFIGFKVRIYRRRR
jgi:hypothetical protein